VRIDAPQLRARIVAEGGNLGLTQLARVEYARAGGRIHTDAIDNSAGVDLSDHEVNLKLALRPLVATGELSLVQRDRVLREVTDEVCTMVLCDNAHQALALALATRRSRTDLLLFDSLIEYLTDRGQLDPQVEQLPNRRQIAERGRAGEGLTKPELAIVLAYVKMGLFRRLLAADLPDEAYFRSYLDGYFPVAVRERFEGAVRQHRLRREITATQMTNRVVDLLGITFVHRMIRDTGASPLEVVRAALIGFELLDVRAFVARLEAAAETAPAEAELQAYEAVAEAVDGVVRWMLLNDLTGSDVEAFVDAYRGPLTQVRGQLADLLPEAERQRWVEAAKIGRASCRERV